ncbi:MAG: hypothetical protein Q9P01_18930 [Anaerolineae bacterium]|nr:hypothetical protein [Anaerolineae bacterium]MDQ7036826.1 hypothetical protein [Anaerolineae bacterium]
MVTLRRVGLRSAGRVGFWFSVATNMAFLMFALVMAIINDFPVTRLPLEFWLKMAIMMAINGLFSSFSAGMTAFLYNIVSKSFGGLQLEFEMPDSVSNKRKNGERKVDVEIEEIHESDSDAE